MSLTSPQSPMVMEMAEMSESAGSENVRIKIPSDQPVNNNNDAVVTEWENCLNGNEFTTQRYYRKRVIEKVPPLLLKTEKGRKNSDYYKPAVVSLGPYHHTTHEAAEAYKSITLQEFCLSCGKSIDLLYNKVFEVVNDARACYVDVSTNKYDNHEFNQMMLRDGCFILFLIECISQGDRKVLLNNEYLGALGFANVVRDIFVLENQIPFVVLEVLLDLRFPKDKGEEILNRFFNYLKYGEVVTRGENVLQGKPLHLLELYRSYYISLSGCLGDHTSSTKMKSWAKDDRDFNYVKRNRSFASAMNLKAKGIFLKLQTEKESSNQDIKFHSQRFYGELELVRRAVSLNTKAIYLNMIAYEMCPHNPNDFRISTYIRVMKSLVTKADDVKELRHNNILIHSLGRDEEVVKMYDEIEVPTNNLYMFNQIRLGIECNSSIRVLTSELLMELHDSYFSSPWKTVALLLALPIMFCGFIQTYFTIWPRS